MLNGRWFNKCSYERKIEQQKTKLNIKTVWFYYRNLIDIMPFQISFIRVVNYLSDKIILLLAPNLQLNLLHLQYPQKALLKNLLHLFFHVLL